MFYLRYDNCDWIIFKLPTFCLGLFNGKLRDIIISAIYNLVLKYVLTNATVSVYKKNECIEVNEVRHKHPIQQLRCIRTYINDLQNIYTAYLCLGLAKTNRAAYGKVYT